MEYRMPTRQEIKEQAKERLQGHRSPCVVVYLLMVVFASVLGSATLGIGALILMPVISVAACGFFSAVYAGGFPTVGDWFNALFDRFVQKWLGCFWMAVKVFLWSLLFWIPGVVKAMGYSMAPYLLAEYPQVTGKEALALSERMTRGYKMDIFVAGLSFIGWQLLAALTLGILEIVFVGPYKSLTFGGIYQELKRNALENGTVRPEELGVTPSPL